MQVWRKLRAGLSEQGLSDRQYTQYSRNAELLPPKLRSHASNLHVRKGPST